MPNDFVSARMSNSSYDNVENRFMNYKLINDNVVIIRNKDFEMGTYRIRKPGMYILGENIVFSPNKENEGKPTKKQLEELPRGFQLGFFAAITIECDNVVLNMNEHSIAQSKLHSIQQTFYSHIELANTPFIFRQGPAPFPQSGEMASNVIIKDGFFLRSSHHGIHGNLNKNIILRNLTFHNFGVAAIALNGATNLLIHDIEIDNSSIDIQFNSLLSHAIFLKPFIKAIYDDSKEYYIVIAGKKYYITELYNNITNEIATAIDMIDKEYNGLFKNVNNTYDANLYGIALSSAGVIVNDFKGMRNEKSIGNENIVLDNVTMKNLCSQGTEIKLLTNSEISQEANDYGSGVVKGPVGDVFDFEKCITRDGYYKQNVVANSQIAVQQFAKNKGTANIPSYIINWVKDGNETIHDIIKKYDLEVVRGRDSMAHIMKGNIGLFISQGYRMIIDNLVIDGVDNTSCSYHKKSASSYGILFTGSKHVMVERHTIKNIHSKTGHAHHVVYKTENENIKI